MISIITIITIIIVIIIITITIAIIKGEMEEAPVLFGRSGQVPVTTTKKSHLN
jgi:hypothetical protein